MNKINKFEHCNNTYNNNNNSCNNDHDNNNNNNEYNEYIIKLYNSVWNNIVIKRIILYHLNIFNILLSFDIKFYSIKEWQQFKYKDYINKVKLGFNEYDLIQLPENIKHIVIPPPKQIDINQIINSIPNHIESFSFQRLSDIQHLESIISNSASSSAISKLKTLKLYFNIPNHLNIPQSITKLSNSESIVIYKSVLPSNLKELKLTGVKSFEDGCLPESLTSATLKRIYDPLIINQLSINGLVKLEFECKGRTINSNIRFPNTLQDLNIVCDSFNATLPNNLKSLFLWMVDFKYEIQFSSSSSIQDMVIYFENNLLNQPVFKHCNSVPVNLKSLKLKCSSIEDNNGDSVLPYGLELLYLFGFNKVLKENQLPSSLTWLGFKDFNQVIDVNVLPSTLKNLHLSNYSHVINPLAIPHQLELLKISNTQYRHPINLPPSTHPNAVIDCYHINLFYDPSNTDIRVLKLPFGFTPPLSKLQLQDKSQLEYLHLGNIFNYPIELSDLPINNHIKILELNLIFNNTINLEHFQNLESIIINNNISATITTTIDNNGVYNYYKLKEIQIPKSNIQFIKHLDINFYKFIVIIQKQQQQQ